MSIENMLDHLCDVYRIAAVNPKKSYGLSIEQPQKANEDPLLTDVPCHFEEVSQDVVQGEPHRMMLERMRVTFAAGTDVKLNDTVKWDGLTYNLQKPKDVRGHHIIVMATRSDTL